LTEIPDDSDVDDISILNNQTPNDNGTSPTATNQDFVSDISSCVSATPTDEDSDKDVGNQASRATTEEACDEDIEVKSNFLLWDVALLIANSPWTKLLNF
jgi:hypothetical protein